MSRFFWKLLFAFWLALAPLGAALLLGMQAAQHAGPIIAVALLISVVLSLRLNRHLTGAAPALRDAFTALSEGRFDTRIHSRIGRRSPLAELAGDFNAMAQQLQASMGMQQRLLAEVSHELRSPLARVHAAIGLAQQNPQRIDFTLARIESESKRLEIMLENMLVLARLEAQSEFDAASEADIVPLLTGIVGDAQLEAETIGRHIVLTTDSCCTLRMYPELLQRALENIVRNALQHTPPHTGIEVTALRRGHQLNVTVADRGPGVDADALVDIFEPFYRARNAARRKGAGLGLAIARNAVLKHGGQISAVNRIGGGLVVHIALPLHDEH